MSGRKIVAVVSSGSKIPVAVAGDAVNLAAFCSSPSEGPQQFEQMMAVKTLRDQSPLALRCAFDEAGTTNASVDDETIFEQIKTITKNYYDLAGFEGQQKRVEVAKLLMETKWWPNYTASVKAFLKAVVQEPGVSRVFAVCLPGGPITEVEHQKMPEILKDFEADRRHTHLKNVRVEMRECRSWDEFNTLLEEARATVQPSSDVSGVNIRSMAARKLGAIDQQILAEALRAERFAEVYTGTIDQIGSKTHLHLSQEIYANYMQEHALAAKAVFGGLGKGTRNYQRALSYLNDYPDIASQEPLLFADARSFKDTVFIIVTEEYWVYRAGGIPGLPGVGLHVTKIKDVDPSVKCFNGDVGAIGGIRIKGLMGAGYVQLRSGHQIWAGTNGEPLTSWADLLRRLASLCPSSTLQ